MRLRIRHSVLFRYPYRALIIEIPYHCAGHSDRRFNFTLSLMRCSPVSAVPCSAPILFLRYRPLPLSAPLIIIADCSSIPPVAVRYPLRATPHHVNDNDERDIAEQALTLIQSSQRRRMPRAEDEEPVRPPDKLRTSH